MQGELNFGRSANSSGYENWVAQRLAAERDLARALGLPLGQRCEVWLKGGVRLVGMLRLRERKLFVEGESHQNADLEVDGVPFRYREMESCTRAELGNSRS